MDVISFSLALRAIANIPGALRSRLLSIASGIAASLRADVVAAFEESERKEDAILEEGCMKLFDMEKNIRSNALPRSAHGNA